jgi:hypothetical protein
VFRAERQVLVDLVGDDERVVLMGEFDDEFEGLAAEDGSGRVVRIIDQDEARAARDGGAKLVVIRLPLASAMIAA